MKHLFDTISLNASKMVTRSYSTSFSLGISFLHKDFRNPIYSIYGFVRFADEIVDSFHDYNKKELSDRWNKSIEIQRDIYSAFLIMNVNDDLETINKQLCNDTYDNFKILHDKEVNRLKQLKANGYKLIPSMGI